MLRDRKKFSAMIFEAFDAEKFGANRVFRRPRGLSEEVKRRRTQVSVPEVMTTSRGGRRRRFTDWDKT